MIRFGKPLSPLPDGRFLDDFENSDSDLEWCFMRWRWPETDGAPVCPNCGARDPIEYRSRPIYKCAACARQYSKTSGTLLAYHKISPEAAAFIAAELSVDPTYEHACNLAASFELHNRSVLSILRVIRAIILVPQTARRTCTR